MLRKRGSWTVTSENSRAKVDTEDPNEAGESSDDESVYSGLEEESSSADEEELVESGTDDESNASKEEKDDKDTPRLKRRLGSTSDDTDGGGMGSKYFEYKDDSSDEEELRNTIGNIPIEWYRDYEHVGYDLGGKKIGKPKQTGDGIDDFIEQRDNPNYWRTITDKLTGQKVILSDKDVELIMGASKGHYPTNHNPYEPFVDFFTHVKMDHPLSNRPNTKASYVASKWEKQKVGQMVHAIKMGWMKTSKPKKDDDDEDDSKANYNLWDKEESEESKRLRAHLPAPKMALPGHAESYNPPPEYLMTKDERQKWRETDPEDRRQDFIPKRFPNLRSVPSYSKFANERFGRCLDLYMCPRMRKHRMNVDPDDLLPKLPKPHELQPFPTSLALVYTGHKGPVRTMCLDPSGQWLATGSDDKTVRLWEVATGHCRQVMKMKVAVKDVAWNPNREINVLLVATENHVLITNPGLCDKLNVEKTDKLLAGIAAEESPELPTGITWSTPAATGTLERMRIEHPQPVTRVTWHGLGDYFCASSSDGAEASAVTIHQLSKRKSQFPFSKSKGQVQCVQFHPIRPFLFVATQRFVRVYDLLKQALVKKLLTNAQWVSSLAVHPGGDNIIIGSYDCKVSWFDMDLSSKPYQTLKHHRKPVRSVAFHRRYPLFASASEDGSVIVCHGMVYNDLMQNPLIVPVKVLRPPLKEHAALSCAFHPSQPWVFAGGSDAAVRLYS